MLTFLANVVFVMHAVFAILVIPSTLLALLGYYRFRPALWRVHNLAMAIMVAGRLTLGRCPAVVLEQHLRAAAGQEMPYRGSYIEYVMARFFGIDMPTSSVLMISATVAILTVAAIALQWTIFATSRLASDPVAIG